MNNFKKIEWTITKNEQTEECESADGRWHLSRSQTGDQPPAARLCNYDLLLSPAGTGDTLAACLHSFIAACDQYQQKLTAIQTEARAQLEQLNQENQ